MGIKVKGIDQTIAKLNRMIGDVKSVRIIRALYLASEQVLESVVTNGAKLIHPSG
ncbi:hypothetical protein [Enterobacter kobei]|uniref:Uncharacterized protein n=1 Tax=Enterobacter kobei TaxID=208224 RepID=A0AAJ6IS38_9ENTR|nr:hypothetical protein [Enterobacter kobei]MCE1224678.1 hypothetical protein [Enterobacter kobei]UOY30534.1 hypothetical protein LCD49_15150 [Enterobacter kobei]WMT64289.1 hypothetical protein M2B19_15295 [Enterobacter kobei]